MQAPTTVIPKAPSEEQLSRIRRSLATGDHTTALRLLNELEQRYPQSGLLRQERANYHRARGDMPSAIAAYQAAVNLNDTLIPSWRALADWHSAQGRPADAAHAKACIAKLASLPPQLLTGSSLLNEGELDAAEELIRDHLVRQGAHIEGMRLLAQIGVKRDVLDDAELLLEKVLELAPDYHDCRYEFGAVLTQRRRYLPALMQARRLLQVDATNTTWLLLYAKASDGLGEYDEALRVYRLLLAQTPDDVTLQLAIAHVQQTRGNNKEAIEAFRKAATLPGGDGSASLALANMKTYRFTDEEIERMRLAEAAPNISVAEHYHLCFALGKALEDRQDYEASFRYYDRGNTLKRSEMNYKREIAERNLRLQAQVCTTEFFAARRGSGCPRPDPIFIVGLPRSGSTLIEQILSSHSRVDGTLELPEMPRLVQQFRTRTEGEPPKYPAVLAELTPDELRAFGEIYLDETRVYRQGAPFFIDKMPGNFRDIGFIHLILPNAKIIDARREPMACCFGNFKQLFISGQEFTYGLEDLGRYYRNYVDLMDHWDRVLPGKILRVRHEDVVDDLESSVRRILDFCGLTFEPACLEFYKTQRSVRTVSSEQVRRPIYRTGLTQWQNFDPWLEPLKRALGSLAEPGATVV
jgi:tetratricopeptide (TPR) repeat protein